MKECYLTTVWHSGTKYFKVGLEKHYRVSYSHLNRSVISQLPRYEKIYVTYRDPLRVAASWANRGHFSKTDNSINYKKWDEQWLNYEKALTFNPIVLDFTKGPIQDGIDFGLEPVNQHSDKNRMHHEIDNNNLDYLYSFIPKDHIDLAISCCGALYNQDDIMALSQ